MNISPIPYDLGANGMEYMCVEGELASMLQLMFHWQRRHHHF